MIPCCTTTMLEEIKSNIDKLIALYETQKQRADELEAMLSESTAELAACKEQITELNKQIDSLKLTGAFTSTGDNSAAKERIEKLVYQIDKCIAYLED